MNARYRLHSTAVAVAESTPINRFHLTEIRGSISGDRKILVRVDDAGHALSPQELVFEVLTDKTVAVTQKLKRLPVRRIGRCYEFQLSFGVVRRQIGVCELRAQASGVHTCGQMALAIDAKAFLLDAA